MKILYIIRHAKSSWKDLTLDDFDRPLNRRGIKDAPVMGKRLMLQGISPNIILSSPAARAKQTAEAIVKEISYEKKVKYMQNIYESSAETLESILCTLNNKDKSVFLIGHNTGLNIFVEKTIGFKENIPTCGIVAIKFSTDNWKDINHENAELLWFDYPKNI